MVQPMPYTAVQAMIDGGNPWGIHEYFKVDYMAELPDEAIDATVDRATKIGSPFTQVIFARLGGAVDRTDRSAMALEVPDAKWYYFYLAMWFGEEQADSEVGLARSFMDAMRPWGAGTAPLNFIMEDEGAAALRASFGHEKSERLVALKDKYDPENVFALNQNIPPSVAPV